MLHVCNKERRPPDADRHLVMGSEWSQKTPDPLSHEGRLVRKPPLGNLALAKKVCAKTQVRYCREFGQNFGGEVRASSEKAKNRGFRYQYLPAKSPNLGAGNWARPLLSRLREAPPPSCPPPTQVPAEAPTNRHCPVWRRMCSAERVHGLGSCLWRKRETADSPRTSALPHGCAAKSSCPSGMGHRLSNCSRRPRTWGAPICCPRCRRRRARAATPTAPSPARTSALCFCWRNIRC